jgi:hypothetical protein
MKPIIEVVLVSLFAFVFVFLQPSGYVHEDRVGRNGVAIRETLCLLKNTFYFYLCCFFPC